MDANLDIKIDQARAENDMNYLIQQIYTHQFADQNSQIEITLNPVVTVRRVIDNKIEQKTYTLDDFRIN